MSWTEARSWPRFGHGRCAQAARARPDVARAVSPDAGAAARPGAVLRLLWAVQMVIVGFWSSEGQATRNRSASAASRTGTGRDGTETTAERGAGTGLGAHTTSSSSSSSSSVGEQHGAAWSSSSTSSTGSTTTHKRDIGTNVAHRVHRHGCCRCARHPRGLVTTTGRRLEEA